MKGLLIKESLINDSILDLVNIKNTEIWISENHSATQPKYWTAINFETNNPNFLEELSKSIIDYQWYVDLSSESEKIVVLKNHVIKFPLDNQKEKENAMELCKNLGIKENQIDWE